MVSVALPKLYVEINESQVMAKNVRYVKLKEFRGDAIMKI